MPDTVCRYCGERFNESKKFVHRTFGRTLSVMKMPGECAICARVRTKGDLERAASISFAPRRRCCSAFPMWSQLFDDLGEQPEGERVRILGRAVTLLIALGTIKRASCLGVQTIYCGSRPPRGSIVPSYRCDHPEDEERLFAHRPQILAALGLTESTDISRGAAVVYCINP